MNDKAKKEVPLATIVLSDAQQVLSKEQKAFNRLLKKIETSRAQLQEWLKVIPKFHLRYAEKLGPLRDKALDFQIEIVQRLDGLYEQASITKTEKKKIAALILNLVHEVLDTREDEQCKKLYNKYSQSDYDAEEEEDRDVLKTMLAKALGVELEDDVSPLTEAEFLKQVQEQYQARLEQDISQSPPPRKKTSKQLAKEAREAEEEKLASQSVREIYRKLAAALHPDREIDPIEKQRKTQLMQCANEAYKKGDLLQLLELQLRLEHIDASELASLSSERLKHYTRIFKEQLAELDMEIQQQTMQFFMQFGFDPFVTLTPKNVMWMLEEDILAGEQEIVHWQEVLEATEDVKRFKTWLKAFKLRQSNRPSDFDVFSF